MKVTYRVDNPGQAPPYDVFCSLCGAKFHRSTRDDVQPSTEEHRKSCPALKK